MVRPLGERTPIEKLDVIRNSPDQIILAASYGNARTATFTFGADEVIQVTPSSEAVGISLWASMSSGVFPRSSGDDLTYTSKVESVNTISVREAENAFIGLLYRGRPPRKAPVIVLTWPTGNQKVRLLPGVEKGGVRPWAAVEVETAGQSVNLKPVAVDLP